jgi:hypothetical protein
MLIGSASNRAKVGSIFKNLKYKMLFIDLSEMKT